MVQNNFNFYINTEKNLVNNIYSIDIRVNISIKKVEK